MADSKQTSRPCSREEGGGDILSKHKMIFWIMKRCWESEELGERES